MLKTIFKGIVIAILTLEAKIVLYKYKPRIIAVTGSVGKTGTKDAVHAVLSKFFQARKGEKSHNSEIGILLTILGVPNAWRNPFLWLVNILDGLSLIVNRRPYPEWLVLEVGSDHPGDVKKVAEWIKPDINIVTAFPKVPVHVEFFSSPEALNAEDAELVKVLKNDGFLILNQDDTAVMALEEKTKANVVTYGFAEGADVRGSRPLPLYEGSEGHERPVGVTFEAEIEGSSFPVKIHGVLGKSSIYAALSALALGKALGLNIITMIEALSSAETPPGRLRLIPGIKNTLIIDDTYNSSPIALEVALKALDEIVGKGRRIAVLGDMLELGKFSSAEHIRLGAVAGEVCDILITAGIRARGFAEGALNAGMSEKKIFQFENSGEAGKYLQSILKAMDIALIKGSQGLRMERVVEEVMLHPEEKEKLLCRQDKEWLDK